MKLLKLGLLVTMTGFIILIVGSTLLLIASTTYSTVGGISGCIVILFIPVCFGIGSPEAVFFLTVLSIMLFLFVFVFLLILYRETHYLWKRIYTKSS